MGLLGGDTIFGKLYQTAYAIPKCLLLQNTYISAIIYLERHTHAVELGFCTIKI